MVVWTVSISTAFFTILRTHKRFRMGNVYEVIGLDNMTKDSEFDDLVSMDLITKIETRQRIDLTSREKRSN